MILQESRKPRGSPCDPGEGADSPPGLSDNLRGYTWRLFLLARTESRKSPHEEDSRRERSSWDGHSVARTTEQHGEMTAFNLLSYSRKQRSRHRDVSPLIFVSHINRFLWNLVWTFRHYSPPFVRTLFPQYHMRLAWHQRNFVFGPETLCSNKYLKNKKVLLTLFML
jgi:hypothetical protein